MSNFNYEEEARIQRQKIDYFNLRVGNKDFNKALDYLIIAEWDEKKAVEIYLNLNKKKNVPQKNLPQKNLPKINNNNNNINTNINSNNKAKNLRPINNKNLNRPINREQIVSKNNNISEISITESLLKNNIPYQNKDSVQFNNFIKYLNIKFGLISKNLDNFLKSLKEHPGIILILNLRKFEEFKKHVPKIINNFICPDINKILVIFPIMSDSFIGSQLVKQFSCYNFPSYIFCKYESEKIIKINGKMEGVFNINLFIDNILKGLPEAKSQLKASLKSSLKKSIIRNYNVIDKGNNDENLDDFIDNLNKEKKNAIEIKDSIAGLSDGQIIQKREKEIRELERQQEEKMKKEEEEKQKILDEENEIKRRKEDYEKEAEASKQLLPKEPDEENQDVCRIVLRYPYGEKTMNRRFLKTDKVNVLYLFVKSFGREIFFEEESNDFDLIYGFPPKNLEDSKNNTLDEEGMFPNAMIQIREKE